MNNDNNNDDVNSITAHLKNVFSKTENILDEWKGDGCLQFSVLFKMLSLSLGWTETDVKEHDPLIRYFIAQHSRYSSRRGARGGIIRVEDKLKLEAEKKQITERKKKEEAAREELMDLINSRSLNITKEDVGE